MTEPCITFTIARNLIAQAAEQGRTIKVTVQGKSRILARLGDAPARTPAEQAAEDYRSTWNTEIDRQNAEQEKPK